ncbi:PTS sugar transporter subunit IIC [Melittangium boletus]|uniref:PTS mannose transporter subunit IID n=1 Tax=Melittangium boletus DSM 14713 TaxID=1294270 RepID=A0A250IAC5_9BACT|nr:PTS sugar transporter subunit IIC [Melittangium boletus]ATB28834.1 PTS mannose transporter subunit IID [Melittangium boletus DSM 14713]
MSGVWTQVALAGIWGGLVAVERKAFLQAMFSRPLVAATVMGALLDDVPAGLFVGMLLELFHLGGANLGASLPDHDTLSATGTSAAAATMAMASGASSTPALWSLAVLLFVGLGRVGLWLDRRLERYAARLARKALASAEAGQLTRAMRQNLWGVWPHFAVFGLLTSVCALAGFLLGPWLEGLPGPVLRGLAWAYPAMASVSAAIAARGSHAKRASLYAGLGAGAVCLSVLVLLLKERL